MIKLNYNSNLLQIINKKNIFFFLVFLLINNCSFDNKTGIWGDSEKEKRKISEIEKKQKEKMLLYFLIQKLVNQK